MRRSLAFVVALGLGAIELLQVYYGKSSRSFWLRADCFYGDGLLIVDSTDSFSCRSSGLFLVLVQVRLVDGCKFFLPGFNGLGSRAH